MLWRRDHHNVEHCLGFPGFRIVLGDQCLESPRGRADVDMRRPSEVGSWDIAFEPV